MKRLAFTMLELIFVIVIMGIIGKFGVELLAKAYQSFIYTKVNDELQSNSASTIEFIASRLQHRIKDSVIARKNDNTFDALANVDQVTAQDYTILEWVSADIDGFRGNNAPFWSALVDLDAGVAGRVDSPETNTTALNALIIILSNGNSTLDDAALYFVGSSSDIETGYGWDGNITAINQQNGSMHPINFIPGDLTSFYPDHNNFTDVYEYYKLAWTANAIVLSNDGNLTFHTDYQPWEGETFNNSTKQNLLMQNVDTFQFLAIGSIIKVQVCVNSPIIDGETTGGYSVCKEKTIY